MCSHEKLSLLQYVLSNKSNHTLKGNFTGSFSDIACWILRHVQRSSAISRIYTEFIVTSLYLRVYSREYVATSLRYEYIGKSFKITSYSYHSTLYS